MKTTHCATYEETGQYLWSKHYFKHLNLFPLTFQVFRENHMYTIELDDNHLYIILIIRKYFMTKIPLKEIKESARKSMLIEGYVVSNKRADILKAKRIVKKLYS